MILSGSLLPMASLLGALAAGHTTALTLTRQSSLFQAPSCDPEARSCGPTPLDSCCSPTLGLVVLAQQWYPALGPNNSFTLHGLWPDTCAGKMGPPNGCDASRNHPDLGVALTTAAPELRAEMMEYWPSYKPGDPSSFWSHEWTKHGTCVTTLHPKCTGDEAPHADVFTYFRTALDLRKQYDLAAALSAKGILPGNDRYPIEDIEAAIFAAYGLEVEAHCDRGRIREIWAWLHVKGKDSYIPAKPIRNGRASCRGRVRLPAKSSSEWEDVSHPVNRLTWLMRAGAGIETDEEDNAEEFMSIY